MSIDTPTVLQQTRDGRLARPFLKHEANLKALARYVHDTYDAKEWGGMDQDTVFFALAVQQPFESKPKRPYASSDVMPSVDKAIADAINAANPVRPDSATVNEE